MQQPPMENLTELDKCVRPYLEEMAVNTRHMQQPSEFTYTLYRTRSTAVFAGPLS